MSRGVEKVFGKTDRCQIFLMDKARSFPYDEAVSYTHLELGHEGLAEAHDFAVAAADGGEVGTALGAADGLSLIHI